MFRVERLNFATAVLLRVSGCLGLKRKEVLADRTGPSVSVDVDGVLGEGENVSDLRDVGDPTWVPPSGKGQDKSLPSSTLGPS